LIGVNRLERPADQLGQNLGRVVCGADLRGQIVEDGELLDGPLQAAVLLLE
jgi:predicted GNAT family N-acyltransferase